MKSIRIISESATTGKRLRDILYQDGYSDIVLSDLSAVPSEMQDMILIIYVKSHISEVFQKVSHLGDPVILLLNPDSYAMYLDRARHAGITLLLMPAPPYLLLEAVQNAAAS